MQIERRIVGEGTELRAEERATGELVISGYAVLFNMPSVDLGGFIEFIDPGAFDEVLAKNPDVRCLLNHDANFVLGRTGSGTLKLKPDQRGVWMDCSVPNTATGRPIFESVKRGDISGQSFSFTVAPDGADWNDDFTERHVRSVGQLFDVGPVTYPAYPQTDIAARSRDEAMRQAAEHRQQQVPDGTTSGTNDPPTNTPIEGTPMTITERRALSKQLLEDAQKILDKGAAENRESTGEEIADANKLMDDAELHKRTADTAERATGLLSEANKQPERRSTPAVTRQEPEFEPQRRTITSRILTAPKNFRTALFGTIERAQEAAYRSGMFILALQGNDRAIAWCSDNGIEMRQLGGAINSKGGYLVPHELSSAVVNLMESYGVTRQLARVFQMGSDKLSIPIRAGGVTAYPISENSAITASDKSWTNATLSASKWAALVKYSSEIAEDAVINIADDLAMEIGWAFARQEDKSFLKGDGTSGYQGVTGVLNALLAGSKKTAGTGRDEFADVTTGDITMTQGLLPDYAKAGAVILCSPAVKGAVFDRLLVAAGGNQNAQVAAGQPAAFNGMPIITSNWMNDTDGSSKVVALIGDFGQAVAFGDRRVMTMRILTERFAELDQLAIMATERFDIKVHQTGTGTLAGPVIQFSTAS